MEFKAVIKLVNSSDKELLKKKVKYAGCKNQFDTIIIKENEIIISGTRTNNKLSSAYEITHSTLYGHLINSLLYLYFSQQKLFAIKSITVNKLIIKESLINQLFTTNSPILYAISNEVLEHCLDNNHKILQNTLLYLLQAISAKDNKRKFERFWMAFNSLYSFDKNETVETNKLNFIKDRTIKNHKILFKKSLKVADTIINDKTVEFFRWNKYLKNNLDYKLKCNEKEKNITAKKTIMEVYEKFYGDINDQNNDYRILNCINKQMSEKSFYTQKDKNGKKQLVRQEFVDQIKNKAENNKKKNKKNEIECLIFFGIDYAYFLRCSFFHGAVNDAYYELLKIDSFDDELKIINEILYALIIDLLNSKLIPC